MIITPHLVELAKRMGQDNLNGQYTVNPNDRIRAARVIDLLVASTSPAAQRGARDLIRQMSVVPWKVIANIHRSASDSTPHINVEVSRKIYHLRLDARGCVFDITAADAGETIRPPGPSPWVRPGAVEPD